MFTYNEERQGCQVCVKISAQLPKKAAQFNMPDEFTLGY